MSGTTNQRKIEHIDILQRDPETDRNRAGFDQIHLRHRALPELNLDEVDPSLSFLGKPLSFPLLISSMTGGDHEKVRHINQNLAAAAEHCKVAMGVGSQRVMFTHPAAHASFDLRQTAPTALLFANLGAVQLNKGFGLPECRDAVDVLKADGLYLHLNPLQEAIQPEGDTCFKGLADRIGAVISGLEVPVLIKEIGSGLSPPDADLLIAKGARILDVAGSGGTSWSRIENHRARSGGDDLGLLFQDWGVPTPVALQELAPFREQGVILIASGGLRNALDMIKSIILGASLCGMAKPFLEPALESPEAVIAKIESIRRAFTTAMFLLGCPNLRALQGNTDLIR
ncbi:MAG: type 2 isopentenyl-diphosphate Delta-isomerase [Verrucomicrobia bacterium]|nr:type 2 isopentenyl-diphosphate Delta-isomerase [Verrucomicrobiota bacterium]MCH8511499.1 type 2 isopentenyl-diphosphate Delta-isomerase [Kiritimatiellia bacterium]